MISVTLPLLPPTAPRDLDHVDRSNKASPTTSHHNDPRSKQSFIYASNDQDWRLGINNSGSASTNMAGQPTRSPFGYDFFGSQQTQSQANDEVPEPGANPLLNTREDGYLSQFYNTHPQSHAHHEHSNQVDFGTNGRPQNIMGGGTPTGEGTPDQAFGWLMSEPPPIVHDINAATPIPVQNTSGNVHNQAGHHHHHVNTPLSAHSILEYSYSQQNQMNPEDMLGAAILSQPVHAQPLSQQHFFSPQMQQSSRQYPQSQNLITTTTTSAGIEPIHTQAALEGITSTDDNSMNSLQSNELMNLIPRLDTSAATLSHTNIPHFAVPQTAPVLSRRRGLRDPNPRLYDFGTDTRFDANGFKSNSTHERHDFQEERLTEELKRLKPINRTPDQSIPPSPAFVNVSTGISAGLNLVSGTKRRRSDDEEEDDDDDESSAKRHRGSSPRRGRQRRASAPGAPIIGKKKREKEDDTPTKDGQGKRDPLNDEQKRQNHIASEQKRRNQIKEGFEELNRIVPDLKEGGFSKSAVLVEVASFAMRLLHSNDELRRRLGIPKETENGFKNVTETESND